MIKRIETEFKLELTKKEFVDCQKRMSSLKFDFIKNSQLSDFFFNIERFDEKSWNFLRIRVYNNIQYEKTNKFWSRDNKGQKIRNEHEDQSNQAELKKLIDQEIPLKLNKNRSDYVGKFSDYNCTLSFDKVIIGNETRYFIECEVKVPIELSNSIRPKIKKWMIETFNLSDRPEGIGMLKLVMSQS